MQILPGPGYTPDRHHKQEPSLEVMSVMVGEWNSGDIAIFIISLNGSRTIPVYFSSFVSAAVVIGL